MAELNKHEFRNGRTRGAHFSEGGESAYLRLCRLTNSYQLWQGNPRGEERVCKGSGTHRPKKRGPSTSQF